MKNLAVAIYLTLHAGCAIAEGTRQWPPTDPGDTAAKTAIDDAFAMRLRGFKTLADLQAAAGAKGGDLVAPIRGNGVYTLSWDSASGIMLAHMREDGNIGVNVITNGKSTKVSNTGGVICPHCSPPLNITGTGPMVSPVPEGEARIAAERSWAEKVKSYKLRDGSTVAETLSHVEALRPSEFKVSKVEGYHDAVGKAHVTVCYFIGNLRVADNDDYCTAGFDLVGDGLEIRPDDQADTQHLLSGRIGFLAQIDEFYQLTCRSGPKPDC